MPQRVPLQTSVPAFTQRTSMDGVTFQLDVKWNERESAWYISFADADGVLIRSGVRMVVDWPLLRQVADARRPPGELYLIDLDGTGAEAALDDLDVRVQLIYVTAAEAAVLEA